MSLRYKYRGENEGLAASFATIYSISKYQEKENCAVIVHSHFSEFNDNASWYIMAHALQQN